MALLIDAHVHIFDSKELGQWWKDGYQIWEYGPKDDVAFSWYPGDLNDTVDAMEEADYSHSVFVNVFFPQIEIERAVALLGPDASPEEKDGARKETVERLPELMYERNRWGCRLVAGDRRFSVLAAIDPTVVAPEANVEMIERLTVENGIKGIKIHPTIQRFWPDIPEMLPVWEVCERLGLITLTHSGSTRGAEQFAAPSALAPVFRRFPKIKIQVAHLGGGHWKETAALAEEFPQAFFDLCEIIEWVGAPQAPSWAELSALICTIGPERVMMGSDFPWYDLDRTAELVDRLEGLTAREKEMILGENAVRIYDLPT